MGGRYIITIPADRLAAAFAIPPVLTPQYNVVPIQVVAIVGLKPDGRR